MVVDQRIELRESRCPNALFLLAGKRLSIIVARVPNLTHLTKAAFGWFHKGAVHYKLSVLS